MSNMCVSELLVKKVIVKDKINEIRSYLLFFVIKYLTENNLTSQQEKVSETYAVFYIKQTFIY